MSITVDIGRECGESGWGSGVESRSWHGHLHLNIILQDTAGICLHLCSLSLTQTYIVSKLMHPSFLSGAECECERCQRSAGVSEAVPRS